MCTKELSGGQRKGKYPGSQMSRAVSTESVLQLSKARFVMFRIGKLISEQREGFRDPLLTEINR